MLILSFRQFRTREQLVTNSQTKKEHDRVGFEPSFSRVNASEARQVYNLFQEPVEQPPLGFSIAEEKIRQLTGIWARHILFA